MGVVTVTVTYECSLDSDDLHDLLVISDFRNKPTGVAAIRTMVVDYNVRHFVEDFGDDAVPKIVVSR